MPYTSSARSGSAGGQRLMLPPLPFGLALHFCLQFCKDIEPGNARAKECLEENREKLSSGCKDEVDAMIERRVHDFRLDPKLRDACEEDIFNMCAYYNVSACRAGGVGRWVQGSPDQQGRKYSTCSRLPAGGWLKDLKPVLWSLALRRV